MSERTIQDARWRHEDQKHPGAFEECPDPQCRAATTEINRERAINGMRRSLILAEVERKRVK
jgi:hypothetical protein